IARGGNPPGHSLVSDDVHGIVLPAPRLGPTGPIVDDPNLTDKKFPGNPTQSYRSREPLRVTGEVTEWQGHSPERLKEMKNHLERLKAQGIEMLPFVPSIGTSR
ncbi:MAG: hypothetical protein E5V18_23125, partial [Mesorhizobium sp.]